MKKKNKKRSKSATPPKKSLKYDAAKEKLTQCFLERKTQKQIAVILGINQKTASLWRTKLIDDMGSLTDERVMKLRREYLASTLSDLEYAKKVAISAMGDSKQSLKAINAFSGLKRVELDTMTRFKVVDPEVQEISGAVDNKLEVSFAKPDFKKEKKVKNK